MTRMSYPYKYSPIEMPKTTSDGYSANNGRGVVQFGLSGKKVQCSVIKEETPTRDGFATSIDKTDIADGAST